MSRKQHIDPDELCVIERQHEFDIAKAQLEAFKRSRRPESCVSVGEYWDLEVRALQLEFDRASHFLKWARLSIKDPMANFRKCVADEKVVPVEQVISIERRNVLKKAQKDILTAVETLRKVVKDASITHVDLKEEDVKYDGKVLTITA